MLGHCEHANPLADFSIAITAANDRTVQYIDGIEDNMARIQQTFNSPSVVLLSCVRNDSMCAVLGLTVGRGNRERSLLSEVG